MTDAPNQTAPNQTAPNPTPTNFTRVEVIDQHGRAFVRWCLSDVQLSEQDEGRTLKIFCKSAPDTCEITPEMIANWPFPEQPPSDP